MKSAILLLSGGLDSTAAAWLLPGDVRPALALTADYGQRAAHREAAAAYSMARILDIPHRTIHLPFLREAAGGALVRRDLDVPEPSIADLDRPDRAEASANAVWVPNRNGVLIAMAATWAEISGARYVVCGFNREEALTFPDNSAEFLARTNEALAYSTRNRVEVIAPTIHMDKVTIMSEAFRAGAPLERCWSCYHGGSEPCGRCESCKRFDRALGQAGLIREGGKIVRSHGGFP
ncbi:MAG TPA: 7-cyano-7-deazaguanine synthase QueC [Planctomycetota bacterium]|jgi:7-cyano-7-deazaguanine synthase|nr:7-cyano-7-deazaguanine synthase QueC [Planctomycetota bacterium]